MDHKIESGPGPTDERNVRRFRSTSGVRQFGDQFHGTELPQYEGGPRSTAMRAVRELLNKREHAKTTNDLVATAELTPKEIHDYLEAAWQRKQKLT